MPILMEKEDGELILVDPNKDTLLYETGNVICEEYNTKGNVYNMKLYVKRMVFSEPIFYMYKIRGTLFDDGRYIPNFDKEISHTQKEKIKNYLLERMKLEEFTEEKLRIIIRYIPEIGKMI